MASLDDVMRPELPEMHAAELWEEVPRRHRQAVWDLKELVYRAERYHDSAAQQELRNRSQHGLTANYAGWTSVDLYPHDRTEPLRFLYRVDRDGIRWMLRDTH